MNEIFTSILEGFKAFPPAIRYILLGSISVAVIVFVLRIFRTLGKVKTVLSSKQFKRNPEVVPLGTIRQIALNVGAINGEQIMSYVDSLTTGLDKATLRDNVFDSYGIKSKDTAIKELGWLLNEGHRGYFEILKRDFSSAMPKPPEDGEIDWMEIIDATRLPEYKSNLKDSIEPLVNGKYIRKPKDLASMSILAWDMGRLITVARICYDCGYITEEEAWELIEEAYALCKDRYSDWKELASGYVTGRCMWSGFTTMAAGVMGLTHDLLTHQDSPWKKSPLQ